MEQYIMALDQGTTSSRCVLFDHTGTAVCSAQKEFTQYYPESGWVEHDPKEIWSSQLSVAIEAMAKAGIGAERIAGIGITNQRETTILWDRKTGEPVYPAIVWQCRRTADLVDRMVADGWSERIREKTGLVPDAYFSGTKIRWILDHVPGAKERAQAGDLLFGTVDTWLIWNLTKGRVHATDYTNASRTMLFDIHKLQWDEEILEYLQIPVDILPEVKPSSSFFGETGESVFGRKIPIGGVAGDQQAALFGQCCFQEGEVKNTYGTGCFLLMNTGKRAITSEHGLLTTIAAGDSDNCEYALEGSVFVAGAVIQWLRDEMRLLRDAAQSEEYAKSVPDTNGVYIVPAFTGLGAPYWNQYSRGTVTGLTRGCKKEHFIRAALESIAYQTHDVLRAMEQDAGVAIHSLNVDGGASANGFLMQFQADILGAEVLRPKSVESTALGAAYLAGLTAGYWKDREEIRQNGKTDTVFRPEMESGQQKKLLEGWKDAIRRTVL